MDPDYDLIDPEDALRWLTDHSRRTRVFPHGSEHVMVSRLTVLAEPPGGVELSADEALAALAMRHHLAEWLAAMEAGLIEAAREAGATWEELAPALRVSDRRAAHRRFMRLTQARDERASRAAAGRAGRTITVTPRRVGHDWGPEEVCLWLRHGRWGLGSPSPIQVEAFGPKGRGVPAGSVTRAKRAAAAAVTAFTGRAVTGWDLADPGTRRGYGTRSWFARLGDPVEPGEEAGESPEATGNVRF
ncbi:hypothetical protein ACQEU6_46370 [Spirillospora sp. CA-108201]